MKNREIRLEKPNNILKNQSSRSLKRPIESILKNQNKNPMKNQKSRSSYENQNIQIQEKTNNNYPTTSFIMNPDPLKSSRLTTGPYPKTKMICFILNLNLNQ